MVSPERIWRTTEAALNTWARHGCTHIVWFPFRQSMFMYAIARRESTSANSSTNSVDPIRPYSSASQAANISERAETRTNLVCPMTSEGLYLCSNNQIYINIRKFIWIFIRLSDYSISFCSSDIIRIRDSKGLNIQIIFEYDIRRVTKSNNTPVAITWLFRMLHKDDICKRFSFRWRLFSITH